MLGTSSPAATPDGAQGSGAGRAGLGAPRVPPRDTGPGPGTAGSTARGRPAPPGSREPRLPASPPRHPSAAGASSPRLPGPAALTFRSTAAPHRTMAAQAQAGGCAEGRGQESGLAPEGWLRRAGPGPHGAVGEAAPLRPCRRAGAARPGPPGRGLTRADSRLTRRGPRKTSFSFLGD